MTKMVKRPAFWIVLVVAVVLLVSLHRLEQLEALQNQPERPMEPLAVDVEPVHKGPISRWVCGEGTVSAVRKRHLVFQASGYVARVTSHADGRPLQEGDRVAGPKLLGDAGTLLARLDVRALEAEMDLIAAQQAEAVQELSMARTNRRQADSDLQLAKKRYGRTQSLYERKARSLAELEETQSTRDKAMAEAKAAQARIKAAEARIQGLAARRRQATVQLENSAIHAPFDGVIARLNIAQGDYHTPTTVDHASQATLLATAPITLIDSGEVEVTLNLPLFDGAVVEENQKAFICIGSMDWHPQRERPAANGAFDAHTRHVVQARVHSVSPVVNISGRSARVKVRARQDEAVLAHGLFVTCWIEVEHKAEALLIPNAALLFRDSEPYVYVADQGLAKQREVQIGLADEGRAEVLAGILPGEMVITRGRYRLFPERPIRIVKTAEANHGA